MGLWLHVAVIRLRGIGSGAKDRLSILGMIHIVVMTEFMPRRRGHLAGAIQGFAGVNVRHGELHLAPALPAHWQMLSFPLRWQGSAMQITINAAEISIRSAEQIFLWVNGEKISVQGEAVISNDAIISPSYGTATTKRGDE